MVLHINIDTYFLSEKGSKIIPGGYHYMSEPPQYSSATPQNKLWLNGPIHMQCSTTNHVLARSMEGDLGALFVNYQSGAEICTALA